MSYNPCILIPVYNHHEFMAKTLEKVLPYGLPVIIIDDGSTTECRKALRDLVKDHDEKVMLLPLDYNHGKGGAVMAGMVEAYRRGYTHALQIDADGQHNTDDIPRFIAESKNHPNAVIAGQPVYDASVPKGRLYGRYVTHFWVWVETLSFDIGDSMCGFRMYPLASTVALIKREQIAQRMDFDIEILVRLYWDNVPIRNLQTQVIYPENGVSHFAMVRDNVRISLTHTKLFFGMLVRLPALLKRKLSK